MAHGEALATHPWTGGVRGEAPRVVLRAHATWPHPSRALVRLGRIGLRAPERSCPVGADDLRRAPQRERHVDRHGAGAAGTDALSARAHRRWHAAGGAGERPRLVA